MQMIRTRIGLDEEVIGCDKCGVVQHLVGGITHRCNEIQQPLAVTVDITRVIPPSPEQA
jgi:hypothetical protein